MKLWAIMQDVNGYYGDIVLSVWDSKEMAERECEDLIKTESYTESGEIPVVVEFESNKRDGLWNINI